MAYTPNTAGLRFDRRREVKTSLMAPKGEDNRDLPQFLDLAFALLIENLIADADGGLKKSKGQKRVANISAATGYSMEEPYFDNNFVVGYGTTVSVVDYDTDTETVIKNDFGAGDFVGAKYEDYFFVSNGSTVIQRISRILTGKNVSTAPVAGEIITGGSSSATAIVLEVAGLEYTIGNVLGTFTDSEAITGDIAADFDADGANTFKIEDAGSSDVPKATVLEIIGARIYAAVRGEIFYAEVDDGSNPPFTNWTIPSPTILADSPSKVNYRNAGNVQAISSIGAQVVGIYDNGKAGFRITTIDSGSTLVQDVPVDFQKIDFGGFRGAVNTPQGVFFANEAGIFQLISGGQTNVPFSEQQAQPSLILGKDRIDNIDFSNGDIIYDEKQHLVLVTCAENSTTNNLVLWYNIDSKAWGRRTNWQISRFAKNNSGTVFGTSSIDGKIFQLFEGETDDSKKINCRYKQEIPLGSPFNKRNLEEFFIQGELSASSSVNINFDIFDRTGTELTGKRSLTWALSGGGSLLPGYGGGEGYGGTGYASPSGAPLLTPDFSGSKSNCYIRNLQRLIIDITESSDLQLQFNWFSLLIRDRGAIRRRNLVKT